MGIPRVYAAFSVALRDTIASSPISNSGRGRETVAAQGKRLTRHHLNIEYSDHKNNKETTKMTKFVTVRKASELTGYTESAINCKISEGVWAERQVWVKAPDGRRLINMEGYDQWAESQSNTMGFESPQPPPSKSTSTTQGRGVRKESSGSPRLPT